MPRGYPGRPLSPPRFSNAGPAAVLAEKQPDTEFACSICGTYALPKDLRGGGLNAPLMCIECVLDPKRSHRNARPQEYKRMLHRQRRREEREALGIVGPAWTQDGANPAKGVICQCCHTRKPLREMADEGWGKICATCDAADRF